MPKYKNGHFYLAPKDIGKVLSSTFEFAVMSYLLQCEKNGEAYPSYNTLAQGLMSRREAIRAVQSLIEKGYLSKESRNFRANLYRINIAKLVNDIDQSTTLTSQPKKHELEAKLVTHSHQCLTVTSEPQSPPSDSQSPPLVTDSHPNNTNKNNTKEQDTPPYGQFENVFLSDDEYRKLIFKFGESDAKERIEILSLKIKSKDYKYKSHYATILVWARDDGKKKKPRKRGRFRGRGEYTPSPNDGDLE